MSAPDPQPEGQQDEPRVFLSMKARGEGRDAHRHSAHADPMEAGEIATSGGKTPASSGAVVAASRPDAGLGPVADPAMPHVDAPARSADNAAAVEPPLTNEYVFRVMSFLNP